MALSAEFTIEPFVPGAPGPHVISAIEAARATGAVVEVGAFGNVVTGGDEAVLGAIEAATRAAIQHGATRVAVQVART